MTPVQHLVLACSSLIGLTLFVCLYLLIHRVKTMKAERIKPQSVALSAQRMQIFKDSRLADNYNHLFELPVLFYALCALAIVTHSISTWFVVLAWCFVASRFVHSAIQCGSNNVMQRFTVFVIGVFLMVLLWVGFLIDYLF